MNVLDREETTGQCQHIVAFSIPERELGRADVEFVVRQDDAVLGTLAIYTTKSLTTPFVVSSAPRIGEVVTNVWAEQWTLPFGIVPIGSPHKQLPVAALSSKLPSLANGQAWSSVSYLARHRVCSFATDAGRLGRSGS
jgi:hypothetical protein